MKTLLSLFLSILFVACNSDPIVITGKIVDRTGIPLYKAEVSTIPPTDIVSTDENGVFYLTRRLNAQPPEIQPGDYIIVVKKEGFQDLQFRVNATSGDIWTKRRQMQNEQVNTTEVDPTEGNTECETCGNNGSTPIIGL